MPTEKTRNTKEWKDGLDKVQNFFDKVVEANKLFHIEATNSDYYELLGRLEALSDNLISARVALGNLIKTL